MVSKNVIDVTATVVDYFVFITTMDGLQVKDINLGTMYFGDKVT